RGAARRHRARDHSQCLDRTRRHACRAVAHGRPRLTLTQDDFSYVRELVRRESAIVLDESKAYLIEARLTPVARDAGVETLTGLVEQLKRGPIANALRARVVEAMTRNETSFFRDVHPFDGLATVVFPALARARAATRTVRVWSAAASTGQEAY